jgi:hypothetical protein
MSADNCLLIKNFDNKWYVKMGFSSDEEFWKDQDYYDGCFPFDTKQQALEEAIRQAEECCVLEYGIIEVD